MKDYLIITTLIIVATFITASMIIESAKADKQMKEQFTEAMNEYCETIK